MHYVYYLLDPETQDLLYIGRSNKPKNRQHAFHRKHKILTVLGVCQRHSDFNKACQAELTAIAKHWPPFNKRLHSGSSSIGMGSKHIGNQNAKGHRWSEVERERIRVQQLGNTAHLGHKHSAETKAKFSKMRTGVKQTEESNLKRSKTLAGRIFSEEHRAKISAGRKAAWNRKNETTLPNNK